MTAPRICTNCGAIPVRTKGLCDRCYLRKRYREHPEVAKPSLLVDRTTYLEDVAARNRAWHEQQLAQGATPKLTYDPSEWMTCTEAAAFWGVQYMVARHRVHNRHMPLQYVGRLVFVQRAAVEAWRSKAVTNTSHPAVT